MTRSERPSGESRISRRARARQSDAAAAEKSPDQGTEEGGNSSELEKLRKKLNVSAGSVRCRGTARTTEGRRLRRRVRRIAEGVKDRDAEERAVATQRNLLRRRRKSRRSAPTQSQRRRSRREKRLTRRHLAQVEAEELQERVEALEAEAESKATLERKELRAAR